MTARGVLLVHSALPALCPHIEWALAAELGVPVGLSWTAQPAAPGMLRAEGTWRGRAGTAGRLAGALKRWTTPLFEVTEEPTRGADGERYAYTPNLGLFRAVMSANGDVLVHEDRLRALLGESARGDQVAHGLDRLLGSAWDDELERYRPAGEGAEVRFLDQVV